jgi:hypothetical protein
MQFESEICREECLYALQVYFVVVIFSIFYIVYAVNTVEVFWKGKVPAVPSDEVRSKQFAVTITCLRQRVALCQCQQKASSGENPMQHQMLPQLEFPSQGLGFSQTSSQNQE